MGSTFVKLGETYLGFLGLYQVRVEPKCVSVEGGSWTVGHDELYRPRCTRGVMYLPHTHITASGEQLLCGTPAERWRRIYCLLARVDFESCMLVN